MSLTAITNELKLTTAFNSIHHLHTRVFHCFVVSFFSPRFAFHFLHYIFVFFFIYITSLHIHFSLDFFIFSIYYPPELLANYERFPINCINTALSDSAVHIRKHIHMYKHSAVVNAVSGRFPFQIILKQIAVIFTLFWKFQSA